MIKIPEYIENLATYKAGKPIEELAREKGLTKIVKLASNENPLGASPKALNAIIHNINSINRYADPAGFELIKTISEKFGKPTDSIFFAAGSDAIIQYIILALSSPHDICLSSKGSFIGWYVNADKLGRKSINIPLSEEYKLNLSELSQNITSQTKIIYLANPNNPTGTYFTKSEFEVFMSFVPQDIVVILDEAYTIYAQHIDDYPNGLDYDFENLIVLRTMSKSYGLAGLRIGFAFGNPRLISAVKKVRLPFEPNVLAYYALIAALDDQEFLNETVSVNKESLRMFRQAFDQLGIKYTNAASNFLMLIFKDAETAVSFNNYCLNNGLILRYLDTFGVFNGIRINSGTIEETEFAIEVIKRHLFT